MTPTTATSARWRSQARLEFTRRRHGLPEIELFGRYNYVKAGPGLPLHRHRGAIEFCFLQRGRQCYRVGGRLYHLRGGDVFLCQPDELHDTGGNPEEKGVLYWLILRLPPGAGGFLGLPIAEGAALQRAMRTIPRRQFRATRPMFRHLDALTECCLARPAPLHRLAARHHVIALLLEVLAAARREPATDVADRTLLARVERHIGTHLGESLPLAPLAAMTGLSLARFKVWFKQLTGIPPSEYILRRKVEAARTRLASTTASITTISYDLGFSSSQYFATVCKRFTGRTPRELRALPRADLDAGGRGRA